tara:strand:- start:207 stop:734 length:528 start_codon:yes stop_codon:yes gene_type:complete
MAKVKIQGHASGTGVLTVTAPNTSSDRTITLPDATGTLLNSDGDGSSLTNTSGKSAYLEATFDVSTASGTLALTGAGFTPSMAICFIGPTSGSVGRIFSLGGGDGAGNEGCVFDRHNEVSTTTLRNSTASMKYVVSASADHTFDIASFDSDGLTFNTSKNGSPTGTAFIGVFCFG